MTPTRIAFAAGLLSAAGVYGLVLGTLLTDHEWWPPGDRTPAYYCHWTLVGVFDLALLGTAVLTFGSWDLPRAAAVAGVAAALLGTAVFLWGARTMQSAETMGVTGDLYTDGPYAYTRNPQYVGMIVGVSGFALAVDSMLVAMLAAVHVGWVLLLPRAEEPHLRAEFGDAYDRYAQRVPRFVGVTTLRRAAAALAS
ncbi:methyltransferase family protein [Haloplanus aerogenes]|uniref:Isoprenylcysteine carboxylmethyltransferase family protein n=1 Tax=Haloplanus aerogenes TaxID=660522 RepID=A0A3M0DUC8_9EURY|nr:isoprenylcysteine carboxylmethyltransferase family protein [Haloplanus aerogenes]AZH25775.1 isoprenylcysteine carboxylmethyltransferase family protein [Haloplanus aerogenes]RMB25512.1 protein-S-isoprenylcysteine O-methyltransferase Ste14 [Haloplanus aerogenes]